MYSKALSYFGGACVAGATGWMAMHMIPYPDYVPHTEFDKQVENPVIPSRKEATKRLDSFTSANPVDVLVIGGGATGVGCALDAQTRGLSTCLVERADFASGTSSKSTKLVHGGVRYLEKAFLQADTAQLKLVWEALSERLTVLRNAPHLSRELPILTPCYEAWQVPYYWAGMKTYDLLAGTQSLTASRLVSQSETLQMLPTLRKRDVSGRSLKGGILYRDGAFDDARFALALAVSAAAAGATVLNYMKVQNLIKDPDGVVQGAVVVDELSNEQHSIHARVVVNAAGPHVDVIRHMTLPEPQVDEAKPAWWSIFRKKQQKDGVGEGQRDGFGLSDSGSEESDGAGSSGESAVSKVIKTDKQSNTLDPCIVTSAGSHIALPTFFGSSEVGLLIPKTSDGRVLFMLPWQGAVIAGTTDNASPPTYTPTPTKDDIDLILQSLNQLLSTPISKRDIKAQWAGLRPLPTSAPGGTAGTQSVVRDHQVLVGPDGLVSVIGGKWTTYRRMAEDAIDVVLEQGGAALRGGGGGGKSVTQQLRVVGSHGWSRDLSAKLCTLCQDPHLGGHLSSDIATHLAQSYGDKALNVLELAAATGLGARLVQGHPVLQAEVVYCARHEMACHVDDFLLRRCRLGMVDATAARDAVGQVVGLMGDELGWSRWRRREETKRGMQVMDQYCDVQ